MNENSSYSSFDPDANRSPSVRPTPRLDEQSLHAPRPAKTSSGPEHIATTTAVPGEAVEAFSAETMPVLSSFDTGALRELALSSGTLPIASEPSAEQGRGRQKFGVAVAARLMAYGISLPLGVVTARLLGPHDKGVYTLVLLCSLLFVYCELGLSTAGIYYVRQKIMTLEEVTGNILSAGLVISALACLVYAAFALLMPASFLATIPISLRASVLILGPVALVLSYLTDLLLAAHDTRSYNITNILQDAIQAIGLAAFILLSRQVLPAAVLAYSASMEIALGFAIFRLGRHTRIRLHWRWSVQRQLFSYGLRSHATALLNLGNLRLDSFLTSLFVGTTALGYYAVSSSFAEMILQLPLVVGTLLFPLASGQSSAADSAKVVVVVARRTLLLVMMGCVGLFAISPLVLPLLFGRAYLPALVPLWLLLPGMIGLTLYKTLYSYLLAQNHPSIGIYSTGLALVATVGLDLTLIPRFGINGAAIASSVAYSINGLVILGAFLVYSRVPAHTVLIPRTSDLTEMWRGVSHTVAKLLPPSLQQAVGGRDLDISSTRRVNGPTSAIVVVGLLLGLWAGCIAFNINLTLFVLVVIGICAVLGLKNPMWLCTAFLIADVTLTDYQVPISHAPSLRVILTVLLAFTIGLALLRGRLVIARSTYPFIVALSLLSAIGAVSNAINGAGISTFLTRCVIGLIIIVALPGLARNLQDVAIFVIPTLLVSILSAATGVAQTHLGTATVSASAAIIHQYHGRAFGLAQTPIALGDALVMVAVVLGGVLLFADWSWRARIGGIIAICVLLFGAYETGSRSVFLAVGAAIAVLYVSLYQRLPRWIFFTGLFLGVTVAIDLLPHIISGAAITSRSSSDLADSGAIRIVLWVAAVLIIRNHLLFGVGYGQFQHASTSYISQVSRILGGSAGANAKLALGTLPVHNDFLMMWVSCGIGAFVLYIAIHLLAVRSMWWTWRATQSPLARGLIAGCAAALAAYFAHEFLHNAFEDSLVFWFLIGFVLILEQFTRAARRRDENNRASSVFSYRESGKAVPSRSLLHGKH